MSAGGLIDKELSGAARWAWVEARRSYTNSFNSNAETAIALALRASCVPVTLKACALDSGVSRLHIHSIRATCAPRVVRSFATTPSSSRGRIPKSSAFETNEVRKKKLQEPTLPNIQSIQREALLETKDENDVDTSLLSNAREYPKELALDNVKEDSHIPQGLAVRKVKRADNARSKSTRVPWEDRIGDFLRKITVQQDFHAKLDATLFKNIMRRETLLRGMPVYDSTFDAVRSGRDLFIQTDRSSRSLQYLLPVIQRILELRPWKRRRRRKVKSDPQLSARPSPLLVLCPTLGHAQHVQMIATRLIIGHKFGLDTMTLSGPTEKHAKDLRTRGFNLLMSTPEVILQWLTLPHAKAPLYEALQDLQTLVVDGKASALRGGDFLQLLKAVIENIPLNEKIQRVVISDKHDPQLDEQLTTVILQDGYEVHQEPQLEQIQETHWAREKEKKRDERAWRRKWINFRNRSLDGPETLFQDLI